MTILMFFHVLAGTLSVLAGSTALLTEKGSVTHRAAGNLFLISMLIMAGAGSAIAFHIPQMITFIAGLFTCYLVITGWLTIKSNPEGSLTTYRMTMAMTTLVAMFITGLAFYFGYHVYIQPNATLQNFGPEPYFFFGALALIAALFDAIHLFRGGPKGKHRIARHLWRMCFALYIAMGSLFTGPGAQMFPQSFQGNWMLSVPENAVIIAMFVWLAIVLSANKFSRFDS